jgi:hypothetical protein
MANKLSIQNVGAISLCNRTFQSHILGGIYERTQDSSDRTACSLAGCIRVHHTEITHHQ